MWVRYTLGMEEFIDKKQYQMWQRKVERELADVQKSLKRVAADTQRKTQEYSAMKGKFASIQKEVREIKQDLQEITKHTKQALRTYDERFAAMDGKRSRRGTSKESVSVDTIRTPKDVVEVAKRALKAAERAEKILERFSRSETRQGKIIPYNKNKTITQKEEDNAGTAAQTK